MGPCVRRDDGFLLPTPPPTCRANGTSYREALAAWVVWVPSVVVADVVGEALAMLLAASVQPVAHSGL